MRVGALPGCCTLISYTFRTFDVIFIVWPSLYV